MHISEQSDTRLMLRQRRVGMGLVMSIFSVLTSVTLLNVLLQGIQRIGFFTAWELFTWLIWLAFITLLLITGILAASTMLHGVSLTLDRETETATIRRVRFLRMMQQTYPIYSVSHLAAEENPEVRVIGLFLMLRSGERIALATVPAYDQEAIQQIVRTVKSFLLHRPPTEPL